MISKRLLLWSGLLLLLAIAGTYVYKNHFEWVEVEVYSPMSVEARKHDLLAANRYLTQLGYRTVEIEDNEFYFGLHPFMDTIVLQDLPDTLPDSAYPELLNWIRDGGHLIVGVGGYHDSEAIDIFLQSIGVTLTYDFEDEGRTLLFAEGVDSDERLSVAMWPHVLMELSEETQVRLGVPMQGYHAFAKFDHQDGQVTVVSGSMLWNNRNIGRQDNARLLATAIGTHGSGTQGNGTIYISDTSTMLPGVFSLLWEHWRWFCLLAMVLGLALLRQAARFGPILHTPETRSNNFARHLLAIAQFQARYVSYDHLLAPARQRVLNHYTQGRAAANDAAPANSSKPNTVASTPEDHAELLKKIHRASGIPINELDSALFKSANRATIVPIVTTLQAIDRR